MEHRNRNYPQAYQACLIYHLTQKIATNATRPFLTKQPGNLRIRACNGPLDSAERRRSNDDDNNTSQFSAHPDHRQDRSAIADNCSQTGAAISITRTITTANLTTNETTPQFMHHRAHCDLVDACQRAVFFPMIFLKRLTLSLFSDCKFNGGIDFPSNYTEGDEFGTRANAMDHVRISSELGE